MRPIFTIAYIISLTCFLKTTPLCCAGKLELVARVSRTINKEIMDLTKCVKEVFEALEHNRVPTLQLVAPSYYLLQRKLQAVPQECRSVTLFRAKLRKFMDEKYWTSIKAIHWIACFLDPSFKQLHFLPTTKREDVKFKRDLISDVDKWIIEEMNAVENKLNAQASSANDGTSDDRLVNYLPLK